jgi:hypothetical protein
MPRRIVRRRKPVRRRPHWTETRQRALEALGFKSYREYLSSPMWEVLRELVFHEAGRTCICGRPATQIHHMAYTFDVLSGKNRRWLTPICNRCHKAIHSRRGGRVPTIAEANARLLLRSPDR